MAIVGGAIVPLLMGMVADAASYPAALGVAIVCYAYILHYALWGHRA